MQTLWARYEGLRRDDVTLLPPPSEEVHTRRRASYLSPAAFQRLDLACHPLYRSFGFGTYLVGSVLTTNDYRDVDVRLILPDKKWDRMFHCEADDQGGAHKDPWWQLTCSAISEWLSGVSGLPVDFQIQRRTQANAAYSGRQRHPMGHGRAWTSDQT